MAKSRKSKGADAISLLKADHRIEEELFDRAGKGAVEEKIHHESYVEHDGAESLIAELLKGMPDDDFYDAKVKVPAVRLN